MQSGELREGCLLEEEEEQKLVAMEPELCSVRGVVPKLKMKIE